MFWTFIVLLLRVFYMATRRRRVARKLSFYLGGKQIMSLAMNTVEKASITVAPVDALGNVVTPNPIVGVPVWTVDNVSVVSLFPNPDGLSGDIVAKMAGTATLTVTAQVNTSTGGTKTVTGTLPITITYADAASLKITVGAVVSQ